MTTNPATNGDRLSDGRFAPGRSGNPEGRPKSESARLRERLAEDGEAVAQVVIDAALAGDMTAAKLVLDRLAPSLKPSAAPIHLELPDHLTPPVLARTFLEAAARGQLPPDLASQLVTATAQLARITDLEQVRQRVEALEIAVKGRKK